MIPVKLQPEPEHFYELVKMPGQMFLATNPHPKIKDWKKHNYWKHVESELYNAYSGICAYSCTWISRVTGGKTVEHFKPKSRYPLDAYCWENYRLVCLLLYGRKGNHEDILDPFILQDGWFVIDFPSLMIFPGEHLSEDEAGQVTKTVTRLKLNDDEACIKDREKWLRDYVIGEISFSHLKKHAPLIGYELERQKLTERNHPIWTGYQGQNRD